MSETLKESLYTREEVAAFAEAFHVVIPEFDVDTFVQRVFSSPWDDLELKQRMRHITLILRDILPPDYPAALDVLRRVAFVFDRRSWLSLNFCDFVEVYGLDNWDVSLPALEQFTQLGSAEFAVRPFIAQDQSRMLAQMLRWAQHDHPDVRRLASEGCRPRLPWGMGLPGLKKDPAPILPILERLKADESEDVRRSVANNLNDIAKDNPQVVIDLLRQWQTVDSEEIHWIIRHSLRTLVKVGNPDALALLGYDRPALAIKSFTLEPTTIQMGEKVSFAVCIESQSDEMQELMVDYVLYLASATGKSREKVFKLKRCTLGPGETVEISQDHVFRVITTRKYYSGEHHIQIQINGQRYDRRMFTLVV